MNDTLTMENAGQTATRATQAASIYEVHLDSWMRVPEEGNRPLTTAEIAPKLAAYAHWMNFTHVELLSTASREPRDLKTLAHVFGEHELGLIVDDESANTRRGWDAIWAYETLDYLAKDPIYRRYHHAQITTRDCGLLAEDIVLPLSHDLVTSEKSSLIARMPGDAWQKFANMRLLFASMHAMPGRKLIFMGDEFGQWNAWNPGASLDWHLVNEENLHGKLQRWVRALNRMNRDERAFQPAPDGFQWIDVTNPEQSVVALLRRNSSACDAVLAVFNFTPVPRQNYRVGVPRAGFWKEILNSDALEYGGAGRGNLGGVETSPFGWHGQPRSLHLMLPPLGAVFLKQPDH